MSRTPEPQLQATQAGGVQAGARGGRETPGSDAERSLLLFGRLELLVKPMPQPLWHRGRKPQESLRRLPLDGV